MKRGPLNEGSELTTRLRTVVRFLMTGISLVVIGVGLRNLEGTNQTLWIAGTLCVWALFMGVEQASCVLSSHLEELERQPVRVRSRRRR